MGFVPDYATKASGPPSATALALGRGSMNWLGGGGLASGGGLANAVQTAKVEDAMGAPTFGSASASASGLDWGASQDIWNVGRSGGFGGGGGGGGAPMQSAGDYSTLY